MVVFCVRLSLVVQNIVEINIGISAWSLSACPTSVAGVISVQLIVWLTAADLASVRGQVAMIKPDNAVYDAILLPVFSQLPNQFMNRPAVIAQQCSRCQVGSESEHQRVDSQALLRHDGYHET